MNKQDIKNLKKRYLIWFYKFTKEALDRIERKFTQAEIDRFILTEMEEQDKEKIAGKFIAEFEVYIQNKEKEGVSQKFDVNKLKPEYYFLQIKLAAIEKAIIKELGQDELKKIRSIYEEEMISRILKSTEH
ncbi:MAG: hypothetical protein HY761_05520 [Candidatus Omnitrophica bacterium]|nr:hypothetical protein [Candidatus Omnitrophota bacterium]